MDRAEIKHAADLLRSARSIVALTGAGISTPSGIPDFRGPEGAWKHVDPTEVASLQNFLRNPRAFYDWFRPLLDRVLSAAPNAAHYALAALERQKALNAVITQNFDGLHQRAGSREVYELHGHLRTATCLECERQIPTRVLLPRIRRGEPPRCSCGHPLKPDVVLFDEMLPRGLYWLARRAVKHAAVIIVAGTSLEVFPVNELPAIGLRHGAKLIIINTGPTHMDGRAEAVIRADVALVLPQLVEQATGVPLLERTR
jgi:NAD-dependent deacetylase